MGKCTPLPAALTLWQCLCRDTGERYHQPIDRGGLTPASRLQPSGGQRERKGIPRTPLSSLRDAAHGKLAGRKPSVLVGKHTTSDSQRQLIWRDVATRFCHSNIRPLRWSWNRRLGRHSPERVDYVSISVDCVFLLHARLFRDAIGQDFVLMGDKSRCSEATAK
ncbi:hypothetical protein TNCV_1198771 [Trichonephila clavipes]|uniref:Uncharacterized protein n=1 Tax=Trichonephila clavipes TaxID=2585209 RepID=A0A8X6V995_TRICX|nr:hypothetical protein TNCV_1198771 [Trichonephila clavipes]